MMNIFGSGRGGSSSSSAADEKLSLRSQLHKPNQTATTSTNHNQPNVTTTTTTTTTTGATRKRYDSHDFAGYGTYDLHHTPQRSEMGRVTHRLLVEQEHMHAQMLSELEATAISGNDILSSTFYVSGLVTLSAGTMAPLCLVLVGGLLYLFRDIYHETVAALPCNGGTYNILLNCTSKQFASIAAVFAIIAYITTGVVSALEAVAYLNTVVPVANETWATIGLLAFFCILTNLGMKESAAFAKIIFVFHLATLSLLTILGTIHVLFNPHQLWQTYYLGNHGSDMTSSYPPVNMAGHMVPGSIWTALFYGLSSAMLGCSGFETSSQFVEEQAPGVFPKTLYNMWLGIMVFNPLLSLISFSAMSLPEIYRHHDTVLARTAYIVGVWVQEKLFGAPILLVEDDENGNDDNEPWSNFNFGVVLSTLVSLDAFIVLAAALLTGFVGINGLIRRMSMDRCMPQFLLMANPWTGTDSIILVGFFVLCVSQVLALQGDVKALGGVYCFSFLSVMTIVALGNILLKIKRPSLPREITTSWCTALVGLLGALLTLLGNILGKPELLTYFFVYFILVGILVLAMFQRVSLMRLLYKLLKPKPAKTSTTTTTAATSAAASSTKTNKTEYSKIGEDEEEDDGEEFLFIPPGLPEEGSTRLSRRQLEQIFSSRRVSATPLPTTQEETSSSSSMVGGCLKALSRAVREVQSVPFVFFCKHDDLHLLNKAMLYIQRNEQTNTIFVVHCARKTDGNNQNNDNNNNNKHQDKEDVIHENDGEEDEDDDYTDPITDHKSLAEHVKLVDLLYPKVKISLLVINAAFTPVTVEWLSSAIQVPINAMFISCPDENFTMKVSQLRGMRIIVSYD